MARERTRLSIDLETLFPGDTIKIGEQIVDIRPLGIKQLAIIARKLKGFTDAMKEDGITVDNYNQPENIIQIAITLLEQFPEVLEEGSNIAIEDLQLLPIDIVVEILTKVMEVNMKSKDKLLGNSKSLAGMFNLIPEKTKTKPKSQKQSKS